MAKSTEDAMCRVVESVVQGEGRRQEESVMQSVTRRVAESLAQGAKLLCCTDS